MTFTLTAVADSKRLLFENGDRHCELHPIWVRERTTEPGTVDEGSLQRVYSPQHRSIPTFTPWALLGTSSKPR